MSAAFLVPLFVLTGCGAARAADEIVVCGQRIGIGTPVVLWTDRGGYNAYSLEPPLPPRSKGAAKEPALRKRYDVRGAGLTAEQRRQARNDDLRLETLQQAVDQFVLHYDVCGTSRQCFKVLQDIRGLSVHFLLDLDGTIYQTLDLKERAWHATIANHRSIGVEIANIGAYPPGEVKNPLDEWYKRDPLGVYIDVPRRLGPVAWRTPNYIPRPRRPEPVVGEVNGRMLKMYDYTPEQYGALIKLTAGLCKTFPKIRCDYPRDSAGRLLLQRLPDGQLARYTGVLGHYHVQTEKSDPGPALDWEYLIRSAKQRLDGNETKK